MAKAAKNNKSIILEGLEVFYNEKTDSLNLISTDPDLPKGNFFMKVKEGTPTDVALRSLFAEKTGNSKPLGNDLTSELPKETVTLTDIELRKNYDRYTFPIGVAKDQKSVTFKINRGNFLTSVLISGVPGCGKSVITEQILRKAEISGVPVLKLERPTTNRRPEDFTFQEKINAELKQFKTDLENIFFGDQVRTEPTLVIIDGLEHYLNFPEDTDDYYQVIRWQENVEELVKLLRLSRSKSVVFVMTVQRPTHYLMERLTPCLTMNIVGQQDTVSSAIVLGTNDAVKLRNGNFITKIGTEMKGMKAYHPALKSDWV